MTDETKSHEGEASGNPSVPAVSSNKLPASGSPRNLMTRSQAYAARVYERVSAIECDKSKKDAYKEKYRSMSHKLPILIQSAGLAQALAFVDSKKEEVAWQDLLSDLNAVVGDTKGKTLQEASHSNQVDLREYIHLTRKALSALLWFKRFSESVLEIRSKQPKSIAADSQTTSPTQNVTKIETTK